MQDVSELIKSRYTAFSKGQRRLADIITESYERAAYLTAAKLGELSGVSESTVVRFAMELGFSGYPHFQQAIQSMLRSHLTPSQRIEATKLRVGDGDLVTKVMTQDIEKIKATMEKLDRSAFSEAVDRLIKADTIYVYGARSAAALACFLQLNLNLVFDRVRILQPSSVSEVFEQILPIGENDVLFAISFPRYSSKLVKAVQYASSRGAFVIALTDSATAPIAGEASCLLTAESDMASFADSLVAPLSIINALLAEIANRSEERIKERFDRLEALWDEYDVYTKP